ncbi:FG-GAP-like repeat-containing protein [Flavobacterium sp.]|uniref:FG-GAP-like repeat-containing protein n=1 Tax=Flavobacterium sp. TaxID=239 RepID=UPI0008AA7898|nr:FG-GAP-like repeat-containing protein [Flavobacterium sp.]OGS64891.1 MAG: hypothetical protein A2X21_03215 [Flavobacteria bacterium GWA2_35_26]HCF03527.1 hypothetical protein [Flavobacterium sp.]
MKKFLLLLLVVASYTMNAQSTFYVATTGSNSNSGTSSSPFLTIQKAVDVASNGDTILVNPGTYSSNVSVNKSLNIFATGNYLDTVLEFTNANSPIFTIFGNSDNNNLVNVTIKGFKFINSNNQLNDPLAIRIERYAFATFKQCWFENIRRGFSTYYGYYHVINSVFKDVEYLTFNDAGFEDDARLPKIINCTIYNSYSITNSGANIYNKIYNSIIVSDVNKTKSYFNGSRPLLDKVIIDDTPNTISGSVFSTVSNVNAIHFNDLATKDFRLKAYSPAIGYGTDMSITEDLSAGLRPVPVATTADAGAFENALGTPVNAPPTINTINNFIKNEDAAPQTFALAGISDGDLFSTQVVTIAATSSNTALIPNPTITYTPGDTTGVFEFSQAADQTGTATITVTVTDDGGTQGGGVNTFSTSFTVTVNPVNDAPVATPQTVTTLQDTNKVITLAGTDIDTTISSLTYSITVLPTSGSLYQTTNGTNLGTKITTVPTTVTNSDGKVIYEPVWNVSGNGTGTFSFKANDGTLLSSQADVTVNTTAVIYPVITIAANPTSFAENTTSTITATLNQTSSRDLIVPITVSGTAGLDVDYTGTFPSKGEETLVKTFLNNSYNRYVQLSDGRLVIVNGGDILIYDPITQTQTTRSLPNYIEELKAVGTTIYYRNWQSITSLDLSQPNLSEVIIVPNLGQDTSIRSFDVIGNTVYYYSENNNTNIKKIYSKTGNATPIEIFNNINGNGIESLSFDATGSFYLSNSYSIKKFDANKNLVTTFNSNVDIRGIKFYNNTLYARVNEANVIKVKKYNSTTNTLEPLSYDVTNTKPIVDFSLSSNGNLQLLRQDSNNRELYNYQLIPQLKIPAGATSGTLTLSAIDDISDEENETIILTPGSVTNATLSSNTAVTVTITDNDAMPTIAFALSAPKIVENSSTDVTLTATPSVVSGKEIRIPFTLTGSTAQSSEYTVSANEIVIPANAASGSITISTRDKNDTTVEVMETIKFAMGTLVNATTTTTEVVLNLESDDNSAITSIVATPITIAENAFSTITATIDLPSSKDVIVPIAFTGTAKLDVDFTGTFPSKGEEKLLKQLPSEIMNFTELSEGKIITLNNYNSISLIDLNQNTTQDIPLTMSGRKVVAKNNHLYFGDWNRIAVIDLNQNPPTQTSVVPLLSNGSIQEYKNGFDIVNNKIYYLKVIQSTGVRLILSKELTSQSPEVVVYEAQQDFNQIVVTPSEDIYVLYFNQVGKIKNNSLIPIINGNSTNINISDIKFNNGTLYLMVMINGKNYIKILNPTTGILTDVTYQIGSSITGTSNFIFDTKGNLILSNSLANSVYGLYNYQLNPQLKIPAGTTTGTLTVTAIDDLSDEEDVETIVLTPGTVSNATLSTNTAVTVNITDNDAIPTVAFALSAPKIVENSTTDVTLTAIPSIVSGKEIRIPFTLSGTATLTTEYTVSANEIVIPANAASGSITISTRDKNDTAVEVMETIKFTMGTIVNASSTTTEVILNLESDDNPTITSIVGAPTTFAENASSIITATIDLPSSKDVIVPIAFTGTAGLDVDYSGTFPSLGEEKLIETFLNNGASRYVQLLDGRYVIANGSTLIIYDPITKTQTTRNLSTWIDELKSVGNTIYYRNWQSVFSLDIADTASSEITLVTNIGQDSSIRSIDIVGTTLYYYIENNNAGSSKIFSKTGSAAAIEVYNNIERQYIETMLFDTTGGFYLSNPGFIKKFDANKNLVTTFNTNSSTPSPEIRGTKLFNNTLYVRVNEASVIKIKKYNSTTNTLEPLSYDVTNTKPIVDFSITSDGNLQLFRQDTNNRELYTYQLAPQLKIPAGSTTGTLTVTGVDDLSDEADETIIVTPGTVTNATLSSTTPVTVTITDNDAIPTVAFALSAPKIVENSSTDVTLRATPSVVSGKEIRIPFTLSGTATLTTEYTVSANEIVIPANAANGSITISTRDKNDTAVEVMETIKFTMGTLVNATTSTTEVVLNLESDDNSEITSIVATPITFAESASSTITATIDLPSSKDVIVPIAFTGTAGLDVDYTGTFPSLGEETLVKTFMDNSYNRYVQLSDGRYVLPSGGNILIYNPITQTQTTRSLPTYIEEIKAVGTTIYYRTWNSISSLDLSSSDSSEVIIVPSLGQDTSIRSFDVVGSTVYYYSENYNTNIKKLYSKTGSATPIEIYNNANNNTIESFSFDSSGSFYLSNSNSIRKFDANKSLVATFNSYSNPGNTTNSEIRGTKLFNNTLYVRVNEGNEIKVKKYNSTNNTLDVLSYDITNTKPIVDFSITSDGNLQLLRQDNSNRELYSYQLTPQIKIAAGSTTGSITLKGIEDDLNYDGQEIDETIILNYTNPINSSFKSGLSTQMELKLLNNSISLTPVTSPFVGLENGAVSWGDYDQDGDQDVAVMGQGISGAVTKVYENKNGVFVDTNQNFTRVYAGDIAWVDINKDGWLDLAVSGSNGVAPLTKIYINDKGTSFASTIDFGLPQLFSSKMAWGDLDNDGDIDLAITGVDASDKFQFNIYYRDNTQNKFTAESKTINTQSGPFAGNNYRGVIDGDIKIVDLDLDGDNDIVYNGASSDGSPYSNTLINTYIKNSTTNTNSMMSNFSYKNSTIEVAKLNSTQNSLSIISSGIDSNGAIELYNSSIPGFIIPGNTITSTFPKLKNGDISVVDFNNDGFNDILFTGEDVSGTSQTKLYFQNSNGNFKLAPLNLEGLRNSTANWVDYDNDGDLDLFLTGIGSTGAKTLLYKSDIKNKRNTAPVIPSGLIAEDLGNGKIKFQWTPPADDYSASLGYVVRLGKTPGGTELSNTESNLVTGDRLITKQAPIYTNFYEMQLDPGKYYWSVQAVDSGLKGGAFAAESTFTLTYDWKILNQGGIIDRSVNGNEAPFVKLADLDNDNDLDLVYGNSSGSGSQILQFDGKRLIAQENSTVTNIGNYTKISSSDVGDIDGDKKADILVNYLEGTTNKLVILTSSNTVLQVGDGLFKSKSRMVDINNDGKLDIVVIGLSSSLISGVPKLWIYEYDKTATPNFKKTDASADIAALSSASFDFGDIDKDQDLDLVITGFSPISGLKSVIYENTTVLGGAFKLNATDNNIVAIKDGTTDLIDVDGDGDLDVVLTGTGASSDVFEIYMNKLNENIKDWPRFASGLTAIRNGKIDLGDFNGDGYSDILYSGTTSGGGNITKLSEYNKTTQRYEDSPFDVSDFTTAEVEFGDLDGDKDLDFVIVGTNKNWSPSNNSVEKNIFRTYINVRNDSALVLASNPTGKSSNGLKSQSGNVSINDYVVNVAPSVPVLPTNASKVLSNIATTAGKYPIELNWGSSTDDHTPSPGLTYAIKIGTTAGGEEIMSANANSDGTRKVSTKGNAEHNSKWKVSLPVGKYYWSVQAIDAAYSGSAFTDPQVFEVSATGVTVNNAPVAISDQITVVKGGTATKLNSNATSVLTNDTDTENNTLTAILVNNVTNGTLTFNSNGTFTYVHNGSDTTTDSFSYKANDGTSNSNTVVVTISIVPFAVDFNNFLIQTKSETCAGKNNGEINIKATQSFNYTATINTINYNFVNNSLIVPNLPPGEYNVCINVTGQSFQQCYKLTIGKGGSLTGKTSGVSSNKVSIEITEGSAPFEIMLNGKSQFTTDQNVFDLDVKLGDVVMVKSSVACEGIYSTVISDLPNSVMAYPNPTRGLFEITVPTEMKEIYVELYSINAVLISKAVYPVVNQKIQLHLDNQTSGTYIAKVYTAIPTSLMIIKN